MYPHIPSIPQGLFRGRPPNAARGLHDELQDENDDGGADRREGDAGGRTGDLLAKQLEVAFAGLLLRHSTPIALIYGYIVDDLASKLYGYLKLLTSNPVLLEVRVGIHGSYHVA